VIETIERDLKRIIQETMQPPLQVTSDDNGEPEKQQVAARLQIQTVNGLGKERQHSFDDVLARVDQTSTI